MNYLMPEVSIGDSLYFYYCGFEKDHAFTKNKASIGLATLPRDRFISLAAADGPGWLITKPFTPNGDHLFLNTAARGGRVRVGVLDSNRDPLAKFNVEHSVPLQRDQLDATVKWRGAAFSELRGQSIRLVIHLENASLFSFKVQ